MPGAGAFAASALVLGDPEIDRRAESFAGFKDLVRQVDAFGKSDKTLDLFLAETVPAILKDSGREPQPGSKKPAKGK